jgi:hypothetical protein
MALSVVQLFAPVALPNAVAVLYTMPTSPATSVLKNGRVRLTNTSGAAVPVTLYADASGNASVAANCCLNAKSVAANDFLDVDLPTMKAGDTLRGFAGTAAVITMHELGGILYS